MPIATGGCTLLTSKHAKLQVSFYLVSQKVKATQRGSLGGSCSKHGCFRELGYPPINLITLGFSEDHFVAHFGKLVAGQDQLSLWQRAAKHWASLKEATWCKSLYLTTLTTSTTLTTLTTLTLYSNLKLIAVTVSNSTCHTRCDASRESHEPNVETIPCIHPSISLLNLYSSCYGH